MPRWLITVIIVAAAAMLVVALSMNRGRRAEPRQPAATERQAAAPADGEPAASEPGSAPSEATPLPAAPADLAPIEGLHARPVAPQPEPVIGDATGDKNNPFALEVKLTPWGGGIIDSRLSRYSTDVVLQPEDFTAYPLQRRLVFDYTADGKPRYRYPLAAESITVNGQTLTLLGQRWQVVGNDKQSATFSITLADGEDRDVLQIVRRWRIERRSDDKQPLRYALHLDQRLKNLSGRPLSVRFAQYGPMDMPKESGYIGDQRHVIFGYLQPRRSEEDTFVTTDGFDLPRDTILDPDAPGRVWPPAGGDERRKLLWLAVTNRYFTTALHVPVGDDPQQVTPLQSLFPTVSRVAWGGAKAADQSLALRLESGTIELAAGTEKSLDVSLYAGPRSPNILNTDPAYQSLGLGQVIVYNLGGCCATCTFAWLANGLLAFMNFIHWLVRDWGIAIMVLVAVVRTILHPLTKGSQVSMMKLSKQMGALQPELEKLKAKYKDNPTKLNQEMMALYREKGVNPASMGLGCLPMLLQMPIWIALYAMLYFAIELRHEPAFWGVFQKISGGHWPFLADLSSQDRFIPLPEAWHVTIPLVQQDMSAINILPLLMGVVFFIQQKYMTPPNPNMSPEMKQQQAMMKWMTVILFPLMLFWAPSGLTLYILTSTAVGIVESKRVRRHIEDLEKSGKLHEKKPRKPGGLMDRLMKAAEARQKMMEEQAKMQQRSGKKKNRP